MARYEEVQLPEIKYDEKVSRRIKKELDKKREEKKRNKKSWGYKGSEQGSSEDY